MLAIATHVFAFSLGLVAGGYLWYRFGSKVAADAKLVEGAAKKL